MTHMQIRARGAAEGSAIVALAGDVDLANASEVEAKLRAYVVSTTGDVRIDCRALEFIDSSFFEMLARIQRQLAADARLLILARTPPLVRKVLAITGVDQMLVVD